MWNILNVKSVTAHHYLNDPDRKPFRQTDDIRLDFLLEIATAFKKEEVGKGRNRSASLTPETRNALSSTLCGFVHFIRDLLLNRDFEYVLPGHIQSDRLEGEFGIYR